MGPITFGANGPQRLRPGPMPGRGLWALAGLNRIWAQGVTSERSSLDTPEKTPWGIWSLNRWEIQIDAATAEILQVAYRRSDLIETIHDGSFFHDNIKLWVFFPTAIILFAMWLTGSYLFVLPVLSRRRKRGRLQIQAKLRAECD